MSDNPERDELLNSAALAFIIDQVAVTASLPGWRFVYAQRIADALLAAGYRRTPEAPARVDVDAILATIPEVDDAGSQWGTANDPCPTDDQCETCARAIPTAEQAVIDKASEVCQRQYDEHSTATGHLGFSEYHGVRCAHALASAGLLQEPQPAGRTPAEFQELLSNVFAAYMIPAWGLVPIGDHERTRRVADAWAEGCATHLVEAGLVGTAPARPAVDDDTVAQLRAERRWLWETLKKYSRLSQFTVKRLLPYAPKPVPVEELFPTPTLRQVPPTLGATDEVVGSPGWLAAMASIAELAQQRSEQAEAYGDQTAADAYQWMRVSALNGISDPKRAAQGPLSWEWDGVVDPKQVAPDDSTVERVGEAVVGEIEKYLPVPAAIESERDNIARAAIRAMSEEN